MSFVAVCISSPTNGYLQLTVSPTFRLPSSLTRRPACRPLHNSTTSSARCLPFAVSIILQHHCVASSTATSVILFPSHYLPSSTGIVPHSHRRSVDLPMFLFRREGHVTMSRQPSMSFPDSLQVLPGSPSNRTHWVFSLLPRAPRPSLVAHPFPRRTTPCRVPLFLVLLTCLLSIPHAPYPRLVLPHPSPTPTSILIPSFYLSTSSPQPPLHILFKLASVSHLHVVIVTLESFRLSRPCKCTLLSRSQRACSLLFPPQIHISAPSRILPFILRFPLLPPASLFPRIVDYAVLRRTSMYRYYFFNFLSSFFNYITCVVHDFAFPVSRVRLGVVSC
jgi:hypothetical protein